MGKVRNNQAGFSAVEVVLVLVIVALIGVVGVMVYKNHNKTTDNKTTATTATTKAPASSTSTQTKTTTTPATSTQEGTITGTASYPSEGLPTDEKVCAVDVANSAKVYCDNVGARQGDLKFSIQVPANDYYVYATAEKELPNYKAYYDEYSKCGNSVNCPAAGHQQYIKVTVASGATVDSVDPGDWYNN